MSDDWDTDDEDEDLALAPPANPDHDSEDSNAESYYANSYPDEDAGLEEEGEEEGEEGLAMGEGGGGLGEGHGSEGEGFDGMGEGEEGEEGGCTLGCAPWLVGGGRGRRRGAAGVASDGEEEFDVDDYDEEAELEAQYAAAAVWRRQLVARAGFPPPPPLPDQ